MIKIFRKNACKNTQRISKYTVMAMLIEGTPTYKFIHNLPFEEWDVMSFDSNNREVCIVLYNNSGNKLITVNLPYISWGL